MWNEHFQLTTFLFIYCLFCAVCQFEKMSTYTAVIPKNNYRGYNIYRMFFRMLLIDPLVQSQLIDCSPTITKSSDLLCSTTLTPSFTMTSNGNTIRVKTLYFSSFMPPYDKKSQNVSWHLKGTFNVCFIRTYHEP